MRVCENHQDKKIVPLIWTYNFPGAEYWCPACGYTGGMMGAGESVDETPELAERLKEYKKKTESFMTALAHRVAISFIYEGKRITPAELPEDQKENDQAIIDNWKYEY
jgi:hypothetical protein